MLKDSETNLIFVVNAIPGTGKQAKQPLWMRSNAGWFCEIGTIATQKS